jgi:hypothetical protein
MIVLCVRQRGSWAELVARWLTTDFTWQRSFHNSE